MQNHALAGNRTRVSRVAGENSTTEPPVLQLHTEIKTLCVLLNMVQNHLFGINALVCGTADRYVTGFILVSSFTYFYSFQFREYLFFPLRSLGLKLGSGGPANKTLATCTRRA